MFWIASALVVAAWALVLAVLLAPRHRHVTAADLGPMSTRWIDEHQAG
jgi:hypothetical protein